MGKQANHAREQIGCGSELHPATALHVLYASRGMLQPRVSPRRELNDEGSRVRQLDSTLGSIVSAFRAGSVRHEVINFTMDRSFRESPYGTWKFLRTGLPRQRTLL